MAIVKTNLQNDLGDIISELGKTQPFPNSKYHIVLFKLVPRVVQEWRVEVHIHGPCEDKSTK